MKRTTTVIATALLAMLGFSAISASAAADPITHAVPPAPGYFRHTATLFSTLDAGSDASDLYWRDPSSGNVGTGVVVSLLSTSNAEDWVLQANGRCGGTVTSTCPGGAISASYRGSAIVTLKNVGGSNAAGADICLGTNSLDNWVVFMKTCDGYKGSDDPSTVFIYPGGTTGCGTFTDPDFPSWKWNESHSSLGALVDPNTGNNSSLEVSNSATTCTQFIWHLGAS